MLITSPGPDAWIRNNHYTTDRLRIERISGDELPMDLCYINLAIIEQPGSGAARSKEDLEKMASPFSLAARLKVERLEEKFQIELPALFNSRKTPNAQTQVPRRILIHGRAGVGKTTLCKKIVYNFTHRNMWNKLFDRVLWVPLRNLKWNKPCNFEDLFYSEYFFPSLKGNDHARELSCSLLRALNSNNSSTLFILDGLDEVQDLVGRQDKQSLFFLDLLKQPNIIITTRPHVILPASFKKPDLELETIGFYPDQVYEYLERVVKDQSRIKEIQSFLQNHPLFHSLVRIPVQLDALCLTWTDDFITTHIPETTTVIYQAIVDRLWRKDILRFEEEKTIFVQTAEPFEINRDIAVETQLLESLAFSGLYSNIIEFQPKHRSAICKQFQPRKPGLSLYETLGRLSFLRTSDPSAPLSNRGYHFLHLTFQEFFAAQYFAKQWRAKKNLQYLDFNGRKSEVIMDPRTFLRLYKYTARYDIFWRFVAGLLRVEGEEELQCFFKMIEEEPVDLLGPMHQRLVMHCLSEVDASIKLPNRSKMVVRLSYWLLFECALTGHSLIARESECPDEALHHALRLGSRHGRERILEALAHKRHLSESTLAVLAALLKDQDLSVRSNAAYALGSQVNLSEAVVTALFKNEDSYVRASAAKALGRQSNLSKVVMAALAALLKDNDSDVRSRAAEALSGQVNLSEAVVAALVALLKDKEWHVNVWVSYAIRRQANVLEAKIAALATLLEDKDSSIRSKAAEALSGQASLSEVVVERLLTLLKDEEWYVRPWATYALGSQENLSEVVVVRLLALLEDKDSYTRSRAAYTLSKQASLSEIVVERLLMLLKNKDSDIRSNAAHALCHQVNLSEVVIIALTVLLEDKDTSVRSMAAYALGSQASLSEVVVTRLLALLKDKDSNVRSKAAYTLSKQTSLSEAVIESLAALLTDKDSNTQYEAANSLSNQINLSEEVVVALATLLRHNDSSIQSTVIYTLGRQGSLPKAVLEALITLLEDEDFYIQSKAIEALSSQANLSEATNLKLLSLLKDEDSGIESKAAYTLSNQKTLSKAVITALTTLLKDKDSNIRSSAANALGGQMNLSKILITALAELLKDEDLEVRYKAAYTLGSQVNLSKAVVASLLENEDSYIHSSAIEALGRRSNSIDMILDSVGLLNEPKKQPTILSSTFNPQFVESFYGVLLYNSFTDQSTLSIDSHSCIISTASGLRTASFEPRASRGQFLTALSKGRQIWNPLRYELWVNFTRDNAL